MESQVLVEAQEEREHLAGVVPCLGKREKGVSVIVAARPGDPDPRALEAIGDRREVIVTRGRSPARQRNAAVRSSGGEYLLFLDDDSIADPFLVSTYLSVLENDPTAGAAGGPAESIPGSRFQDLAALVLGEPCVVGKTAARYRPLGRPRFTDERELILCNLCVRRTAFEEAGGFREDLYPNEENEFLERLRIRGWGLVYRPDAVVRRPQRRNVAEFLSTVWRYGRGRGIQTRRLASKVSLGRIALALVFLTGLGTVLAGLVTSSAALALPVVLYGIYLLGLGMRLSGRAGALKGALGALLTGGLHASYALGVAAGLVFGKGSGGMGEVRLEVIRRCREREARGAPKE